MPAERNAFFVWVTNMDEQNRARLSAVQTKYVDDLMQKANVVGVGVGLAQQGGAPTDVPALVVLVTHKVPLAQLAPEDIIPKELDGVRVDVQATGVFTTF